MKIVKWYTVIMMILSLISSLYRAGKNNEEWLIVILAVLLEMPMIIYVILS